MRRYDFGTCSRAQRTREGVRIVRLCFLRVEWVYDRRISFLFFQSFLYVTGLPSSLWDFASFMLMNDRVLSKRACYRGLRLSMLISLVGLWGWYCIYTQCIHMGPPTFAERSHHIDTEGNWRNSKVSFNAKTLWTAKSLHSRVDTCGWFQFSPKSAISRSPSRSLEYEWSTSIGIQCPRDQCMASSQSQSSRPTRGCGSGSNSNSWHCNYGLQ